MTPLAQADLGAAVTDGFRSVATFVPRLVGFLLILLVGYFVAKAVATVLDKVLERAGFDRAVERGGIKKALAKSQYDASDIVSKLAFYAIFIPFLSAAVGVLGIQALQQPLAQFIALIPQIIVAVVLVVLGAVIAGSLKRLITGTLGGLSYGGLLGNVAAGLVLLLFVKAALDQVGVATDVTGPLLYAILGTVAGVIIVGAGGGLIKPMQHRWEGMLDRAERESATIKETAQQNRPDGRDAERADAGAYAASAAAAARSRDHGGGDPQGGSRPGYGAQPGTEPPGYGGPTSPHGDPVTQQMPAPYPGEGAPRSDQDLSSRDPYGR